ncbi:MAG: class I SAM-dependent DNA methyltransferase, partial [Gemmatimonadota bacterium]
KLKSGDALTPKERKIHEIAACGVLKDLHGELDALVAKAYGWEWPLEKDVILERLVALHDERVKEEKAGTVRWLRPDYQISRFGKDLPAAEAALGLTDAAPAAAKKAKRPTWPADVISQIGAIKRLVADEALSAEDLAARFTGAKADIVRRHLDILLVMGEVLQNPDGRYQGAA